MIDGMEKVIGVHIFTQLITTVVRSSNYQVIVELDNTLLTCLDR
jgi:hypothetical protein